MVDAMASNLRDIFLVVVGVWLLGYRVILKTRCGGFWVKVACQVAAGSSLVLLAPGFNWLVGADYAPALLAVMGALMSLAGGPTPMALFGSVTLGLFIGGLIWQLGTCGIVGDNVPYAFVILLTCSGLSSCCICCNSSIGELIWHQLTLPMLASAMLVSGVGGLAKLPQWPLLGADAIWQSSPCADSSTALDTFVAWLALAAYGVLFHAFLLRLQNKVPVPTDKGARKDGRLADSLLPDAMDDGPLSMARPDQQGRTGHLHRTIADAICAPEGRDQSHLTDHERAIVAVCRSDPDERDRVLWGGGLY